ncbi:hypothetical protein B0A49_06691 [Cryomyces minteri]|uniref:Coenzyme Q-binding protein COQ10 START domain-containing protein n=1 Tax=Cryomyces minteri TaxID=331657 RepID=A0A4U0X0Q0_9PEZI|nr:hypothetical protein B0A49_06691 [Cryomyces minteri]
MTQVQDHPRPTPLIPEGGLFSPYASAIIRASPSRIHSIIIDTSSYPKWNTFVPNATITKQPNKPAIDSQLAMDTHMTLKGHMTESMPFASKEIVSMLDEPKTGKGAVTRICWNFHGGMLLPGMVMKAERVNEIEDLGDGTCEYRTWETFGGMTAHVVRWKYGKTLQERFEDWVRDLKAYAEGDEETLEARKEEVKEQNTVVASTRLR